MKIVKLSFLIIVRLSKEILEKLKFFKKIGNKLLENVKTKPNNKPLYAQASAPKVSKILKIKENFPNLSAKN